jgi:hypothetical protein
MATSDYEIIQATAKDIDGILDLQERNQPERGGTLSARFPRACSKRAAHGVRQREEGRYCYGPH